MPTRAATLNFVRSIPAQLSRRPEWRHVVVGTFFIYGLKFSDAVRPLAVVIAIAVSLTLAASRKRDLVYDRESFTRIAVLLLFAGLTLLPSPASSILAARVGDSLFLAYAVLFAIIGFAPSPIGVDVSTRAAILTLRGKVRRIVFGSSTLKFLTTLALLETGLAVATLHYVFVNTAHIVDGSDQIFHAKMLAQGHLSIPTPEWIRFFRNENMIEGTRWYSQYPPGFIVLLALGEWLHVPWLVNPLVGAAIVIATYHLGKELYSERTGRIAAILALSSPFLLFLCAEYMNHATALLLFTLELIFAARFLRRKTLSDGLAAGFFFAWLFSTRPWTAFALNLPVGIFLLPRFFSRLYSRSFMGFALGAGLILIALGWFNYHTNGSPLTFGYIKLYGASHYPGFGKAAWGPPHTVSKGIVDSLLDLARLNEVLFEWPFPSLIFIFILFGAKRKRSWDWLLLATAVSLLALYATYFFRLPSYGPRFLFEASTGLFLLTARGMTVAKRLLGAHLCHPKNRPAVVLTLVTVTLLSTVLIFFPRRANEYKEPRYLSGTTRNIVGARELLRSHPEQSFLFFVPPYDFAILLGENSPSFKQAAIFARDLGDAENPELCREFPNHLPLRLNEGVIQPYDCEGEKNKKADAEATAF